MFYDEEGTKTSSELWATEWRDAWKTLAFEGTFRTDQLGLSARVGYFEDLSGARGGIVLKREGAGTEHVGLWDVLTRKNLGDFQSLGLCFGGGIRYARFAFDLSVDQYIYDFATNNYKFSFSYQF
jgi:hypothetical protein